jgi:hypothetical protein
MICMTKPAVKTHFCSSLNSRYWRSSMTTSQTGSNQVIDSTRLRLVTSLTFRWILPLLYAVSIAAFLCYCLSWHLFFVIITGLLAWDSVTRASRRYHSAAMVPLFDGEEDCPIQWSDLAKLAGILFGLLWLPPLSGTAVHFVLRFMGNPISGAVGLLVTLGMCEIVRMTIPPLPKPEPEPEEDDDGRAFERGRRMLNHKQVRRQTQALNRQHKCEPNELRFWGGMWIPDSVLGPHFQVVGKTRSGKTLTLRLYMQSALPSISPGSNRRAIVYDAKGELLPVLRGMNLSCPIISLNPLDASGFAWDIAADITDPNAAKTVAEIFAPEEKESQKYFPRSARRILEAVLRHLIKNAPGRWNLADVLLILNDVKLLRHIIRSSPSSRHLITKYFKPESTFKNTLSTLDTLVSRYETVAACWARAEESGKAISISDWLRSNSILVITRNQDVRQAPGPHESTAVPAIVRTAPGRPRDKFAPGGRPAANVGLLG